MAKLYFRYGVVSSAKTLNLLATVHNYEKQNKKVVLIKPALDTRTPDIQSRAGLSHKANILLEKEDSLEKYLEEFKDSDAIVVDEVQFLTTAQIEQLRLITIGRLSDNSIPVICYGLRTKSDSHLWDSVIRLMALADSIEEVKTTCTFCNKKAVFSKSVENTGKELVISWDAFIPVCAEHYYV